MSTRLRVDHNVYYPVGACAVVSAFGTAILFPIIRGWGDANLIWWLLYVLTCAVALGGGKAPLRPLPRLCVALLPPFCQGVYLIFYVFVLGREMRMSELDSGNPRFWILMAFVMTCTWAFAVAFSFARNFVEMIVRWLSKRSSDQRIHNVSRAIAALLGVGSAVALLLKAWQTQITN